MSEPRYRRSPTVIARRVADETLLVPIGVRSSAPQTKGADLFVLNDSGERLWEQLTEAASADDMARNLITVYGISPEQARADVSSFVDAMLALGAIERAE